MPFVAVTSYKWGLWVCGVKRLMERGWAWGLMWRPSLGSCVDVLPTSVENRLVTLVGRGTRQGCGRKSLLPWQGAPRM